MGQGIHPRAAVFETGLAGVWTRVTRDTFGPEGIIPSREIQVNVPLWMLAADAEFIGELESQVEKGHRARSVATAALLGMLTVGTSKGWIASDNHVEIKTLEARSDGEKAEEEEVVKLKKKLQGNLKSYTFPAPGPPEDPNAYADTNAQQFLWVFEERFDPDEKLIGFTISMLIFDEGFSNDDHWQLAFNESQEVHRAGTISGVPEALRTDKFQKMHRAQRGQINDEFLERTAPNQ